MAEQDDTRPGDDAAGEDSLLTPEEIKAFLAMRKLREQSDQLIRKAQRVNRAAEFLHRFPPPECGEGN